jgi:hypothetical protein
MSKQLKKRWFSCGYDCSCCFGESEITQREKNVTILFRSKTIENSLWLVVEFESTPLLSGSKIEEMKNEYIWKHFYDQKKALIFPQKLIIIKMKGTRK